MKRTAEQIIADKIANRNTELHHVYDRACAQRLRLMVERDRISDQLAEAEARIARCLERATEQGYPNLFAL